MIVLVLGFAVPARSTTQGLDVFEYDGKVYETPTYPLESYPDMSTIRHDLMPGHTGNQKSYIGNWQIVSNRLLLVRLEDFQRVPIPIIDKAGSRDCIDFNKYFPGCVTNGLVFANWFSGTMFSPGWRWGGSLEPLPRAVEEQCLSNAVIILRLEHGIVTQVVHKVKQPQPAAGASRPRKDEVK